MGDRTPLPFEDETDFYIPSFIWNFWLEAGYDQTNVAIFIPLIKSDIIFCSPLDYSKYTPWASPPPIGLHVYDTYNNVLRSGLSDRPFSPGVFDQILSSVPEIEKDPIWKTVNSAFRALEEDAETAIRSLLQQSSSKSRPGPATTTSFARGQLGSAKFSLSRHSLCSLQKYLIFLRFRNRDTYVKLVQRASRGRLFCREQLPAVESYEVESNDRGPMSDFTELLKSFTNFLSRVPSCETSSFDFICECIHRRFSNIQEAEICIGLSPEPDEYILGASCFGLLAEEDGVGNM